MGKAMGNLMCVGSGWSFSMDNIVNKIAIEHRVFVHSESIGGVGTHSFLHLQRPLSRNFSHVLPSLIFSHGPFILSSTLPQRPPDLHVLMQTADAYH